MPTISGTIYNDSTAWQLFPHSDGGRSDDLRIYFPIRTKMTSREAIEYVKRALSRDDKPWLVPNRFTWVIDVDRLREWVASTSFPGFLAPLDWLKGGRATVKPEMDFDRKWMLDRWEDRSDVSFYIDREEYILDSSMNTAGLIGLPAPREIHESLVKFRADHPDGTKVAFIMMKFGETGLHDKIVQGIKSALVPHGIMGLRADEQWYHDDLFYNILTYIFGCGLGIAVFERIESNDFNPNISLEVGYMMGLNKPVCLLKDGTLPSLQTDLAGKLYKKFNIQDPIESIPPMLRQWLADKRLA